MSDSLMAETDKAEVKNSAACILVVDDEAECRKSLVRCLRENDYQVITAASGGEALETAAREKPDLILLDVRMPTPDGIDVCRSLKKDPALLKIPVIFLSAWDDSGSKIEGFAAGGVDFVSKTALDEELLARVQTHLSLHCLQQDLQQRNRELQREIEERKRVESQAQTQWKFLHTVLNSLPHPLYVIDAESYQILLANAVAVQNGIKLGGKCHQDTHGCAEPCTSAQHPCPLDGVKKTGKPFVVEHTHKDQQGRPIMVEVHGYPIFDDKDRLIQMIEYTIDVSERKQLEAEREKTLTELREALAQVKLLSGVVPICMYCKQIRDDQGYWNQLEKFISENSSAEFSHGICPRCLDDKYPERDF